jgi:hypothetical protein
MDGKTLDIKDEAGILHPRFTSETSVCYRNKIIGESAKSNRNFPCANHSGLLYWLAEVYWPVAHTATPEHGTSLAMRGQACLRVPFAHPLAAIQEPEEICQDGLSHHEKDSDEQSKERRHGAHEARRATIECVEDE